MSYEIQVKLSNGEYTTHSYAADLKEAVDQADMVHGRIVDQDFDVIYES